MTCNNIILSQPQSGATLSHDIPDDVSARLNFGSDDISGLRLGNSGELIISFTNGGTMNLTNFEDLISNGNLLYLEDGTLVDPSVLTSALQSPANLNSIDTAAGAATNADAVRIAQPAANTTQEISMTQGQKYVCDFDPANAATVEVKDGSMILTFADGSQVVINNYSEVMAGDLPAEMTVADGTVINGDELLTQVTEAPSDEILEEVAVIQEPTGEEVANIEPAAGEDIAQQVANIEPAAGETGGANGNSGYGFNSSPVDVPLNSPDAIGPLNPTALQYVAPQVDPINPILPVAGPVDDVPFFIPSSVQLDETNLSGGNVVQTGTVNVDYGNDGPGTLALDGNFAAGANLTGGSLTSNGVPVIVTQNGNTFTGTANGNPVFTFEFDPQTGDYTYTQIEQFDHSDTANDNENITLDFGVTATDNDGDVTSGTIRVNVLDDAPIILSPVAETVDETTDFGPNNPLTTNGTFFAIVGQDTPGTYGATNTFSVDGQPGLTSCGLPVTVSSVGNVYTGTVNGQTAFTLTIDTQTGDFVYEQFLPLDHPDATNPDDVLTLNFGASLTDFDGDTRSGDIIINVRDDGPVAAGSTENIDETDLVNGPIVETGSLTIDFGNDGAAQSDAVVANGNFTPSGSLANNALSSGGVAIVVTNTASGYVGTLGPNGPVAFTLDLNQSTGDYTFTQNLPLDHADTTNPNDIITLTFGATVTDKDGDTDPADIVINIADDAPVFQPNGPQIGNGLGTVDETDFNPTDSVSGTLVATGQDGPITFDPQPGVTPSGSMANNALTSCGEPVTITLNNNVYTGTANGQTVFTLEVNPTTGEYTYTQIQPLDHADTTNPNDAIFLTFDVNAVDSEGDTDGGQITITVLDDAPVAAQSSASTDESNANITANGTLNIAYGNDGAAAVNSAAPNGNFTSGGSQTNNTLTSGGVAVVVTATPTGYVGVAGGVTIFTLDFNPATGVYSYSQNGPLDHADGNDDNDVINLNFGIGLTDKDGDTVESVITINVADDAPVANNDTLGPVAEGQTAGGNVIANDDVGVDVNGTVTQVLFNGNVTSVPAVGNATVVGTYGTLTISADGTYSYTANNNNPDGTDVFTYTLRDSDGDTDTANLSITATPVDDTPIIVRPAPEVVDDTNLDNGPNVETGTIQVDYQGDGPGMVMSNDTFSVTGSFAGNVLMACGEVVTVTDTGSGYIGTTATLGTVFTLEIEADGDYTFTQIHALDHADVFDHDDALNLNFGIKATDADGDTVSTTLTVQVKDDGPDVNDIFSAVDETDLRNSGTITVTDTVPHDFGQDGQGTIEPNGGFMAKFQMNGANVNLTSGGQPVAVAQTANGYEGSVNGNVIFTLTVNPATGEYTYTQTGVIDHPDATNHDDVIWLLFNVTITDKDGDTDTANIIIDVHDDGPEANNDNANVREGDVATGNVQNNDVEGADGNGTVTQVLFNGSVTSVPAVGNATVVGTYGTLTISANGTYSYTPNSNDPDGTDVFTYTLRDGDGDTDTANLSIDVSPDRSPIAINGSGQTDDTNLSSGPDVETGTINVNYQGDGPGVTTGNNNFSVVNNANLANGTLSSNGTPVNVSFNASNNTYTGVAGGVTIFTMEINANGTYDFTQFENLDHGNTSSNNEAITLRFGVDATDSDGDTGSGTVTINVRDDAPNAVNDTASVSRSGNRATGNVLNNDDAGEDNGSNVSVTTPGTYVGNFGTLTLNANGSYTYVRSGRTGGTDRFDYTMRDHDGDTDTAQLSISVTANPLPPPPPPPPFNPGGDGDGCPLVIDLDGDGIELIRKQDGVLFDIDEDGIQDQTAWVGADDGILVRDINEDGIINDHSEMFGNDEIGGFEMLAQSDDNNDGVIDAQDAIWSTLKIWQDRNGDAFSQADEFITFDELGIEAISLQTQLVGDVIAGNYVGEAGEFITEDGDNYGGYDAWFQYDSIGEAGGTAAADKFIFTAIQESATEISNFDVTEDSVDLSALIQGADDVTDAINEFVFVNEVDGDTVISVDIDGAAGPAEAVEVAKLKDVTSSASVEELVGSGVIEV